MARETVVCSPNARLVIRLQAAARFPRTAQAHWASADLHVHMNYGGAYRDTPAALVAQQAAENLFLVEDLVVNKEQRIPDNKPTSGTTPDPGFRFESLAAAWSRVSHTLLLGPSVLTQSDAQFSAARLRCIRQHRGVEPFPCQRSRGRPGPPTTRSRRLCSPLRHRSGPVKRPYTHARGTPR